MCSACGTPLPPESPPTEAKEPLQPLPVVVESTAEGTGDSHSPNSAELPSRQQAVDAQAVLQPTQLHRGELKTPESVLYDSQRDLYWVSNIAGSPTGLDNNGYLSQLQPNGEMKNAAFIAGGRNGVTLNAPKGMALRDGVLFVADIDWVRRFDAETGEPKGGVHLPKASFLNDIALGDDGSIFVSDTGVRMQDGALVPSGSDAIYRISGEQVTVFAQGSHLQRPNGLLSHGSGLLCVMFGSNELVQFDAHGEVQAILELPAGRLDGLVRLPDGRLAVSSWDANTVFAGTLTSGFSPLSGEIQTPADLGFDSKRSILLVPSFKGDTVWSIPLSSSRENELSATPAADRPPATTTTSGPAPSPHAQP